MKRVMAAAALTFAASLTVAAQANTTATRQGSSAEQDVLKLQSELRAAEDPRTINLATAERLIADDAVIITPEGTFTKAQAVAMLKGLAAALKDPKTFTDAEIIVTGETAHVFGDTAVVVADAHIRGQQDGRDMEDTATITSVWARRRGRWQLVLNNIVSKGKPRTDQIKTPQLDKN